MSWQAQPIYILDFEGNERYGIIEYGIVRLQNGELSHCQTALCKADKAIAERETWLHGLKREDTQGHPPFDHYWNIFNELRQAGPFCAHHASVEHRLLKRYWPYPGKVNDFSRPDSEAADWGPWLDTRAIYKRLYPDLPEHKLASLIDTFELQGVLTEAAQRHCPSTRSRFHCALYDALASSLLLKRLAQIPELARLTITDLFTLSLGSRVQEQQDELF